MSIYQKQEHSIPGLEISKYNEKGMGPGLLIESENVWIHTFFEMITTIIPFEKSEKVCWKCGKNRNLEIVSGFKRNGGYTWGEVCGRREKQ